MAVEARHLNLFPSHFLSTRAAENAPNMRMNGTAMATDSSVLPFYNTYQIPNPPPPLKDNSIGVPRKRPREEFNNSLSFLGEDLSLQLMQHQLEADRLISVHMERVRLEMEERRRMQSRRVIGAIDEAVARRLKEKEEQMERMAKHNQALEERIRSLYVENQIWRDLARANEAAAISLQSNLDQILAQQQIQSNNMAKEEGDEDDAESWCGSNEEGWRKVKEEEEKRMCKVCGGKESCVLVLPCRHLCVCTDCGASVEKCPLCNSTNNATLRVHFS